MHIFAAEAAITFSVLAVGGMAQQLGRLTGSFASSLFYIIVAYYEVRLSQP